MLSCRQTERQDTPRRKGLLTGVKISLTPLSLSLSLSLSLFFTCAPPHTHTHLVRLNQRTGLVVSIPDTDAETLRTPWLSALAEHEDNHWQTSAGFNKKYDINYAFSGPEGIVSLTSLQLLMYYLKWRGVNWDCKRLPRPHSTNTHRHTSALCRH